MVLAIRARLGGMPWVPHFLFVSLHHGIGVDDAPPAERQNLVSHKRGRHPISIGMRPVSVVFTPPPASWQKNFDMLIRSQLLSGCKMGLPRFTASTHYVLHDAQIAVLQTPISMCKHCDLVRKCTSEKVLRYKRAWFVPEIYFHYSSSASAHTSGLIACSPPDSARPWKHHAQAMMPCTTPYPAHSPWPGTPAISAASLGCPADRQCWFNPTQQRDVLAFWQCCFSG